MHGNNKLSEKNEFSFCGSEVRRNDPDRFLVSLAFPESQREALWAIFAFNYEIAKTREVVSEPTLGHIRLQWWREGVEEIAQGIAEGKRARHEVLAAVAKLNLPPAELNALIDAREFDLSGALPRTLTELQSYAIATSVPLARLVARVTGADPDEPADAAIAYSLTGILRAVPALAAQCRCMLPADLISAAGFTEYDLYAGKASPEAIANVVSHIAPFIHLDITPKSRYLRTSAAITRLYRSQLEKAGWNPFAAQLKAPPLLFPIRVLWAGR